MKHPIIPCYPTPGPERALTGLYLDTELPDRGQAGPFVYANYVASLDGRISVPNAMGEQKVPGNIANARDWRLLQELAGHADLLLSSGRYLRELDAGSAQDILPIGSGEAFADIRSHRLAKGLTPQPDVAVLSVSLDFAVPHQLLEQGRRVIVITGQSPDPVQVKTHEAAGIEVMPLAGVSRPQGSVLGKAMASLGYQRVYAVTGPYVLHTLMQSNLLDALFLTTVHRIIGGGPFSSICEGELLATPGDFQLTSLYHDLDGPDGCSQSFARYDRAIRASI